MNSPPSTKVVVADAGPLIALGRLDLLHLLPRLFSEIQVTQTVIDECLARPELEDAKRIAAALDAGWLISCQTTAQSIGRLDAGEASAIARAMEIDAGLIMDDRAARHYAEALGLQVIGTLGVLVLAKRRGFLDTLYPVIENLRHSGHHLGDEAIQAALAAANEKAS